MRQWDVINTNCSALNRMNPSCDRTRRCSTGTGCRSTEAGTAPGSLWSQTTRRRQSPTETCHLHTHRTHITASLDQTGTVGFMKGAKRTTEAVQADLYSTASSWRCRTVAAAPGSRSRRACRGIWNRTETYTLRQREGITELYKRCKIYQVAVYDSYNSLYFIMSVKITGLNLLQLLSCL